MKLEVNEIDDNENENIPLITNENKPADNTTLSLDEIKLNLNDNVILVLSSEGYGVSKDVMKSFINYNIHIPPHLEKSNINKHPFDIIDSLDVGVSAGIIMNHLTNQIKSYVKAENGLKLEENSEVKLDELSGLKLEELSVVKLDEVSEINQEENKI